MLLYAAIVYPVFHSPRSAEKTVKINLGGLAAITGINPYNSSRCALDRGKERLSCARKGLGPRVRPRRPLWDRPGSRIGVY